MPSSIGDSLNSAINGIQRNVEQAIKTVSQLARDEDIVAAEALAESESDSVGGNINVTV